MVFYFTGTGNSLYLAKGLEDNPISIPQVMRRNDLTFTAEKIGIVCPIYGHEMPKLVKEFLQKAVFTIDYLYAVLTYGNAHGGAAELAAQVFQAAGKTADYITTVLMVDNFLPSFDMDEQCALDKDVEGQLARVKVDIDQKKAGVQKASIQDKARHQKYLAYVNHQPETIWASYRVTEECIGCGICTRVCPAGCIHLEQQISIHVAEGCQACMACIHACPKLALQMTMKEANTNARYRNEHISLAELIVANEQTN